jgi:hypothetical protein
MAKAWQKHGMKALEKCAKNQPAAFCKMYVLLVPREMKVAHSQGIASLTDEQIETAIAAIREMLDKREKALAGEVIEGKAEPVALPSVRPRVARRAVMWCAPAPGEAQSMKVIEGDVIKAAPLAGSETTEQPALPLHMHASPGREE